MGTNQAGLQRVQDDQAKLQRAADLLSGKGPVPPSCLLCRKPGPVLLSHVVPGFVFDWLKGSSATGYLRNAYRPNLRQQDGPKMHMLCGSCERMLSVWENETRQRLFWPLHQDPAQSVRYDTSFMQFCVSVSWRVLTAFRTIGLAGMDDFQLRQVKRALGVWSNFLLGRRPNPGRYEQHVILLSELADASNLEVPPNINRYSLRVVNIDVATSDQDTFVFSKMCGLMLIGFIAMSNRTSWSGTKVHDRDGRIGPTHYCVPAGFLDYLFDKASALRESEAAISLKQRVRIKRDWHRNMARAAESETMRVQSFDVGLFGKDAFAWESLNDDQEAKE